MRIKVDTVARASAEAAFAAAIDIASWPRFMSAMESVEVLTPGAVATGTRFRETRRMFGRSASEEMTVAEIDPQRRLLLTAFSHGTAYEAEHAFAPEGGGTRITLTFEARPVALLSRIFAPLGWLSLGVVKRQLAADLADLAREAERRHGGV